MEVNFIGFNVKLSWSERKETFVGVCFNINFKKFVQKDNKNKNYSITIYSCLKDEFLDGLQDKVSIFVTIKWTCLRQK